VKVPSDPFGPLSGRGFVVIESYDDSGGPRLTPMDAVGDGAILYARTDSESGKVRRIMANPRVRVAATDLSGKPKGKWFEGEARIVRGAEMEEAVVAFEKEYGRLRYSMFNMVARFRGQSLDAVIRIELTAHRAMPP
jgi:uncharacterized protein